MPQNRTERRIWESPVSVRTLARLLRAAEEGDATGYLELAEAMEEKDLHYAGVLSKRKRAVAQLEIGTEAASDGKWDVAAADLVRDWLNRDELQSELVDILDALGKGYSVIELLWDTSASQWMPRLKRRDPRWFEFDRADGETLRLRDLGGPRPLAPYQFIVHVHAAKSGLPIRGGLARGVAWGYLFKIFNLKSWVQFAETFGRPLRLGRYGPEATETDKRTLLSAVRDIAQDAAAIIPKGMEIEWVEAKISGNVELHESLANYIDTQVSKYILGQTATTDAIAGGHAVGRVHRQVEEDIETADALQLAGTLNRQLVRPLVDLNLGPPPKGRYPRIRLRRPPDVSALMGDLARLVPLGLDVEASWVRDRLGVPDPAPGAVLLRSAPTETQTAAQAATLPAPAAAPQTDALAGLIADALGDWQPLATPLLAPVFDLLKQCKTLEEFRRRLGEAARHQDGGALAERLARTTFTARLAGEAALALTEDGGDGG